VGVFPLRFETTAGIAAAIEPLAVYGLPEDYWHTYRSRIEAVTAADVLAAARDLVRPDDALILLTGDAARLRDDLAGAGLGPLEVVPAS
jgi:zinc protease